MSSLLFDVGVYTAVLGLVMVAFNILGAPSGEKQDRLPDNEEVSA